jgi:hypothetical protein
MEIIRWVAVSVVFGVSTYRCGKSIEKRDWGESVAEFLFALGAVLMFVKNTPAF